MNPECRAGKHDNCDGVSDLDENDREVPCCCVCHQPPIDELADVARWAVTPAVPASTEPRQLAGQS